MKKPRPTSRIGHKRRTLGWTLLTLGLLVAALWVWSGWAQLSWRSPLRLPWAGPGTDCTVTSGELNVSTCDDWGKLNTAMGMAPRVEGLSLNGSGSVFPYWSFRNGWSSSQLNVAAGVDVYQRDRVLFSTGLVVAPQGRGFMLSIHLWPLAAIACGAGAVLLRSGILARRRANAGLCKKCGYDLAGLAPGPLVKCPECGA